MLNKRCFAKGSLQHEWYFQKIKLVCICFIKRPAHYSCDYKTISVWVQSKLWVTSRLYSNGSLCYSLINLMVFCSLLTPSNRKKYKPFDKDSRLISLMLSISFVLVITVLPRISTKDTFLIRLLD